MSAMSADRLDDDLPDFDHALPDGVPRVPTRWECGWGGCLDKGRWWRSAQGVILCMNCHPPTSFDLVVARGDAADAPPVHPDYSSTAFDPSPRPDCSGRPLWILRGDRVPEKVVARGRRRKVEVPAGATHWCHAGDREWTPFDRAKPPEFVPLEIKKGS